MNKNTLPSQNKVKVKLLLDSDVLIHFFKADEIFELPLIFREYEYILFDVVHEELRQPAIRYSIDLLINKGSITLMEFPTSDVLVDYEFDTLRYHHNKGIGESACMAFAKYYAERDGIIASSNLKDLLPYCQVNNIPYITTLDFLCRAIEIGLYTEEQCDDFIKKVLNKGSYVPVEKMRDYDCSKREVLKFR